MKAFKVTDKTWDEYIKELRQKQRTARDFILKKGWATNGDEDIKRSEERCNDDNEDKRIKHEEDDDT